MHIHTSFVWRTKSPTAPPTTLTTSPTNNTFTTAHFLPLLSIRGKLCAVKSDSATEGSALRKIKSVRDTIRAYEGKILNYFISRSTNASAESLNSKLKAFRSQLRGVRDIPFFYRVSLIFG